jgi:hypothetical protein
VYLATFGNIQNIQNKIKPLASFHIVRNCVGFWQISFFFGVFFLRNRKFATE